MLKVSTSYATRHDLLGEHVKYIYAKRVLTYLKGTLDFGLIYEKGLKDLYMIGYSDSDFAGDVEDKKSTSGHVFFLGGLPITWNSLKQKVEALSL